MDEIMVTLFDQEKVMEIHDYHIAKDAREAGLQEGRAEQAIETWLDSIQNLMKSTGWPLEQAVTALNIPEEERKKCLALQEQQ